MSSNMINNNNSLLGMSQLKKTPIQLDNLKTSPQSPSPSNTMVSREISDQLSLIIKKIGNNDTSKEGINELYDFKLQNPDIDLNKYFKNSSGKLQAYIQENLKLVEIERNNQNKGNYERHHFIKNGPIRKSPDQNCKPFFCFTKFEIAFTQRIFN
jgi:hypothetical protein